MTSSSFPLPFGFCFSSPLLVGCRGFVAVILIVLVPIVVLGQERTPHKEGSTQVGIVGELGVGVSQGSIPVYAGTPDCGLFESGEEAHSGLVGILRMPKLFGGLWGLSLEFGWKSGTSVLETAPNDPTIIFDSATVAPVTLDRTLRLQRDDQRALFRSSLEYWINPQFTVGIGGTLSYRLNSTIIQTDNVTGPGDHSFEDGVRSRTMNDGERLSGAGISLSLSPSVDYTLPLGQRILGFVGIAGEVDLLSMVERLGWRDLTIRGKLGMMLQLGSADTSTALSPTLPPLVIRSPKVDTQALASLSSSPPPTLSDSSSLMSNRVAPQPLVAHLELNAYDVAGEITPVAVVNVDEVQLQRQWEIRRGNGVVIDERLLQQQQQFDRKTVIRFVPDSLGGASVPELQAQLLNIIGYRMVTLHPNALLMLHGSSQQSGAVQKYLHDIWGIELGRIQLNSKKGSGGGANQREGGKESLTLLTDTPSLFDPVALSTQLTNVDPPRIRLAPAFHSGAGIYEWKIRIVHDGQSVGEYSSQSALNGSAQINWRIAASGTSGKMTTLLAELNVRDSSGASTTAAAQLPLQVIRMERVSEQTLSFDGKVMQGRWILPYSMIANFNGEYLQERILDEVVIAVQSADKIEMMIVEENPKTREWGKNAAAKLRAKCTAAGKRCIINTKTAAQASGIVEIRVIGR